MPFQALLRVLMPRDDRFYDILERQTALGREAAAGLTRLREGAAAMAVRKDLQALEERSETEVRAMQDSLARTFATPIDREDIHYLASSLDDVADYILASAKNLELFGIGKPDETCRELARLVNEGARIVQMAVQGLRNMHKTNAHSEFVVQINRMENQADEVHDRAIQRLFAEEKDPIQLIRMRDMYSTLEMATDKCEDVGNVIESIMLKYA
jgi:predicted phosphate transport protein (TIGR00153 family)